MSLRIHVIQHVPFEGPAAIGDWAAYHGHSLTATHLYAGSPLPSPNIFDVLVVMGGPMSVHDQSTHHWLGDEILFLQKVLVAGKKILGICLGAQMLAKVLGGHVIPNDEREIGWFPVKRNSSLQGLWNDRFPEEFIAFHWHGETFSVPDGATNIGSSDACAQQGFVWKDQVLALQFHLETTDASTEALIANSGDDFKSAGTWVSSPEDLRKGAQEHGVALNRLLNQVLDAWLNLNPADSR
jgi:GMP synthase-like glutamine amidotransferase